MLSRMPRQSLGRLPFLVPEQQVLLLHAGGPTERRRLRLLVLAALAVLTTAALLFLSRGRAKPGYVLVIDAGSSGTRIYAYTWQEGAGVGGTPLLESVPSSAAPHKVPRRTAPGRRAYQRVETEPGLDRFVGNAKGLQVKALGPLLEWAEAVVPRWQWEQTPVFLFGTAGLRKLSEDQQEGLLEGVQQVLERSAFCFRPAWARIISGTDEGVYGWVALNYLEGTLHRSADTLGVLDLGGSSLEITFAANSVPWEEDAVNTTVLGTSHQLYAHVHHHYGLNDAFDRSVSILLAQWPAAVGGVPGGASQASEKEQQQIDASNGGGGDTGSSTATSGSSGDVEGRNAAEKAAVVASSTLVVQGQASAAIVTDSNAAVGSSAAAAGQQALAGGRQRQHRQRRLQAPTVLLRRLLLSIDAPAGAAQKQQRWGQLLGELLEVKHPCLHDGYRQRYSRLRQDGDVLPDPPRVVLVGKSDYAACQQLARAVVNANTPCFAPPCALGTPQPSSTGHYFVALTGFFVVYRFFSLPQNASVRALEKAGQHFCAKSWAQVQQGWPGELMLENYCFRAPYIAALVTQGLLLEGEQLRIGDGEVGWTLGAALAEGYRLAGLGQGSNSGAVFSRSWAPIDIGSVTVRLLAAVGVVAVVLYIVIMRWRQRNGWGMWRCGKKLASKGSTELLDLSVSVRTDKMGGGAASGLAGLIYSPPPLSSRSSTPPNSSRNVCWAASMVILQPGTTMADVVGNSTARTRSQSWAALEIVAGDMAKAGLQRETSYSSNLNRLGRSLTFSRRSLVAASPDGD